MKHGSAKTSTSPRSRARSSQEKLNRKSKKLTELLIERTVNCDYNPGLVRWIHDPMKKRQARALVEKLRGHLEARQGNWFRSDFQSLTALYMSYLNISYDSTSNLAQFADDFVFSLETKVDGPENAYHVAMEHRKAVQGVRRALKGIRSIGNLSSHPGATWLSDAELIELCGYVGTIGNAMPALAVLYVDGTSPTTIDEEKSNYSNPSVVEVVSESARLSVDSTYTLASELDLKLSSDNYGDSDTDNDSPPPSMNASRTKKSAPRGSSQSLPVPKARASGATPPSTVPPTQPSSGMSWAAITKRSPSQMVISQPMKSVVPSSAARSRVASYRFLYERPRSLPMHTDGFLTVKFSRMLNHIKLVPKANLCLLAEGHSASCRKSHSYLEVMRYNPFFKLITCCQHGHFWGKKVREDDSCVCIHVDTGLEILSRIASQKSNLCASGDGCRNENCFKSHSYEEICWYKPSYKTKTCDRGHNHDPPPECEFHHAHDRYPLRQWKDEHDHVGKNVKLLFAERTHKPLADALEALRYVRAHES